MSQQNYEWISNLTDRELREELLKFGETAGPLTPSTRKLFETRLVRKLNCWKNNNIPISGTDAHKEDELDAATSSPHFTETKDNVLNSISDSSSVFYAVFPQLAQGQCVTVSKATDLIFTNRIDALKAVKKYKGARFKCFSVEDDALKFVINGPEQPHPPSQALCNNSNVSSSPCAENLNLVSEKSSMFRGPSSQDLVKLRKFIEKGDGRQFYDTVWSNPRYLISCGDTPSILQEGSRYNALHIAAKSKEASLAVMILDTVQDPEFQKLLYPDDTEQTRQQRINFLTDLYLNTPDKALCETPLHFASKYGCTKIVEILSSHPACDKKRFNKYNQLPSDVICDRVPNEATETKEIISVLLGVQYFVPLMRSDDITVQPLVGKPWSPNVQSNDSRISEVNSQLMTPLSPEMNVCMRAIAGPMSPEQADVFYKRWKTAPSHYLSPKRSRSNLLNNETTIRLTDIDKGMERIGRDLSKHENVPWTEYWSFLDCYCDLSSSEGLQKLESHLNKQAVTIQSQNITSVEKEDEYSSLQENSTCDSSLSSISKLCLSFQQLNVDTSTLSCSTSTPIRNETDSKDLDVTSVDPVSHRLDFDSEEHITSEQYTNFLDKNMQLASQKLARACVNLLQLDNCDGSRVETYLVDAVKTEFAYVHKLSMNRDSDISSSAVHSRMAVLFRNETVRPSLGNVQKILTSLEDNGSVRDKHITSDSVISEHLKCIFDRVVRNLNKTCSCSSSFLDVDYARFVASLTGDNFVFEDDYRDDADISSSSSDVYYTPDGSCASSICDGLKTPEEGVPVYMCGSSPSKLDLDVLRAIESVKLTPTEYPNVYLWKQLIEQSSSGEKASWETPVRRPKKLSEQSRIDTYSPNNSLNQSLTPSRSQNFTSPTSYMITRQRLFNY